MFLEICFRNVLVRRVFRTECVALNRVVNGLIVAEAAVASIPLLMERPRRQRIEVAAHDHFLVADCKRRLVARRLQSVVRPAHDALSQRIKTVQRMHADERLRVPALHVSDVSPDILETVQLVECADKVAAPSLVPWPARRLG